MALLSFEDPMTEEIFHGIHTHAIRKNIPPNILIMAERKLDLLNGADSLETLNLIPANANEGVSRDAHGKHSIPIEGSWRLTFRWAKNGPEAIELKQ